jgi:hypothetical protein
VCARIIQGTTQQGLLRAFAGHAAGGPLNADEMCGQTGCRAGPAQQTCSPLTVVFHSAEWFNTLGRRHGQAGSYSAPATQCQRRGPPVRPRYRSSDATTPHRTTGRVQARRQGKPTPSKISFATPSRCALQPRVLPAPRPPVGPWDSL